MFDALHNDELPAIPGKRCYDREVRNCAVKPHVALLGAGVSTAQPAKRRGNRRYYQREDVELVRTIRSLLYSQVHHWRGPTAAQQ